MAEDKRASAPNIHGGSQDHEANKSHETKKSDWINELMRVLFA